MTHILKATKPHFRFSDLKSLANPVSTLSKTSNIPLRFLASLFCSLTRDGMYAVHKIAQDEKLIKHVVFKADVQMEGFWIFGEADAAPGAEIIQELKFGKIKRFTVRSCHSRWSVHVR
jgi:hypothetical protein